MTPTPPLLAPLGLLGRYYAARNVLGHYRSDAVTAVYSLAGDPIESAEDWFEKALRYALARTVLQHPSLCFGIVGEGLLLLEKIEWDEVVEFWEQRAPDGDAEHDEFIGKILGKLHERIWTNGERSPAWKVVVVRYRDPGIMTRVDVVILAHHAIVDGLSTVVFQRTLLEGFQRYISEGDSETAWPVSIPRDVRPPAPLEQLLALEPPSGGQTAAQPLSVWAGADIQLPSIDAFQSCVLISTISSSKANNALQFCKRSKITLTGYIHGLMVSYLCRNIAESEALHSSTPYSARAFTGAAVDEIANHISCIESLYMPEFLEVVRKTAPGSVEERALIVQIALRFSKDMAAELAICPAHNVWSPLLEVQDMVEYCRKQVGSKRTHTYELSNLGVAKMPAYIEGQRLELEKFIFTQSGFVAGAALGCDFITLGGGPSVLCLTWQHGIVEDNLMKGLKDFLTTSLERDT